MLAEAADVLSDQLRVHLHRMAVMLGPHTTQIERRFLTELRKLGFDKRQRSAVAQITPGAAARILAGGLPTGRFFEQVEYNGRRLAKFNLPPSDVLRALQLYDRLLTPELKGLPAYESANFQWVREQLHFCVVLTLNNAYYQVREAETQAFYELFRVELESRNLDQLLVRFLKTLVGYCRAEAGHLFLLNDEGTSWVPRASAPNNSRPEAVANSAMRTRMMARPKYITREGPTAMLLDPSWTGEYVSYWSIPLAMNGKLAGVMQFAFGKPYEWLPRELELLDAAAERCLMAAEKARLMEDLAAREEQVRQLGEHILQVEEVERRRISRELHDEAGQSLLCVRLQMEMLEQELPDHLAEWRGKLRDAREMTERTILEIRRLIAALSPAVLQQLGLAAALRQLVNRFRSLSPVRVKAHLGKLGRMPQQTEMIVYRLVQECFNNIAKHSAATHVNLSLVSADGVLRFEIEDDGVGFDIGEALAKRDSFGLAGMRERVALLGGKFAVESCPAAKRGKRKPGTSISIELPIPKEGSR